jgi:hypothetical protein
LEALVIWTACHGFWEQKQNYQHYIKWYDYINIYNSRIYTTIHSHRLEKDLNINSVDDWYRVNRQEVVERGGGGFLQQVKFVVERESLRQMFG